MLVSTSARVLLESPSLVRVIASENSNVTIRALSSIAITWA